MKMGGDHAKMDGFTIVETMIVLGVSGVLLFSAMALVSSRQAKTEFQTAIQQVQQQLQQVINEVETGYYPNNGNFTCQSGTPLRLSPGAGEQGANGDCIFLGKSFRFGDGGPQNTYTVYSVAGNRISPTTLRLPTVLSEAYPTAIAPGNNATNNSSLPDQYSVTTTLPGGLEYVWAGVNGVPRPPSTAPFDIAIMSDLASYDVSGVSPVLNSGSQTFSMHGYTNNWAGVSTSRDVVDHMNANSIGNATISSMEVCLASGGTNQSGLFSISGTGTLSVSLQIKSGRTC